MKTRIGAAIGTFGGAAVLVLALGFGAVGASPTMGPSTALHPSSSVMSTLPGNVHHATLTGCISGLDC